MCIDVHNAIEKLSSNIHENYRLKTGNINFFFVGAGRKRNGNRLFRRSGTDHRDFGI